MTMCPNALLVLLEVNLPRFKTSNKPQVSDSQSDQLTVTWNKWTTDDIGDGPVVSYKVYYRESDKSDWISGQVIPVSDTSLMSYTSAITGLQWSTQYEITVTVKRPGPLGEGGKLVTTTSTTLCATVAYKDITFFNRKALPSKTDSTVIGGYSAGSDETTSFTYGRVIDTGTGDTLPSDVSYVDQGGYARRMTIQAGSDLPGVYYCDHSGFRLQTVLVASQAEIYPESQTKTVSWGDDVTLTMTIQLTSISESQLKWKHNSVDIEALNGQSSITITSAKPSDEGIYECYTTEQQRQNGNNGFMRLIVRRCPNGKYGDTCLLNCPTCHSGGICNADTGECICPPGFTGDDCNTGCAQGYWGKSCERKCSITNTATACIERMFCVSDPYGCSCLASHGGLDCNILDCPSGTYGAGCTQTCHCTNGCNTKGECISSPGDCDTGWSGNMCKVPSSCPDGFYGKLCKYNCHCENNAACDKNTGVCPNGDCAPGWINLDTIDYDCQQGIVHSDESY
ncbi:uncharacterized protein LOC144341632 [Saccoglossus kowalevskii]